VISGLDISNVNGALDLASLARQYRLSFAILKATEGTGFRDPLFPAAWEALKQLGLARGTYHFAHPSGEPDAEAAFFLAYVRENGLLDADVLALDLEVTDGLPPEQVAGWARRFCSRVSSASGRRPLVYTFISFAVAGNCAGLGRYPLWIADPSSTPGSPRVPGPWTTWAVHQYGQQGIDLDVANYPDAAAMTRALGRPRPSPPAPPKPVEDDMVSISPLQLPAYQSGPAGATAAVTVDLSSAGTFRAIGFSSHWSLAGQPQPAIRVEVHSYSKGFTQTVPELMIPQSGKAVVVFTEHDVDYLSVSRANGSPALVSAGT